MSQNHWSERFTTFAVGVGVGALLALLFAPASGEETRDYLGATLKGGMDGGAVTTGKRWGRRAQSTMDEVKASVAGAVEAGEKAFRTAKNS